jgi:uncharacterized membrane protein
MLRGLFFLVVLATLGVWKPLLALILVFILGMALFKVMTTGTNL